jgi:hypothetical protein
LHPRFGGRLIGVPAVDMEGLDFGVGVFGRFFDVGCLRRWDGPATGLHVGRLGYCGIASCCKRRSDGGPGGHGQTSGAAEGGHVDRRVAADNSQTSIDGEEGSGEVVGDGCISMSKVVASIWSWRSLISSKPIRAEVFLPFRSRSDQARSFFTATSPHHHSSTTCSSSERRFAASCPHVM